MTSSTQMPLLSACLIVRNDADCLDRCLDSLADLADEIVVVDTGSIDGSREIARRRAHVFREFVWRDDFSAARNDALRHATGAFVFFIDADEYVVGGGAALKEVLLDPALLAARVAVTSALADGFHFTDHPLRVVRREASIAFHGRVYESVDASVERGLLAHPEYRVARVSSLAIQHDGLLPPVRLRSKKRLRNTHLLRIDLIHSPSDIRTQFLLARELGDNAEGRALAVAAARRAAAVSVGDHSFAPALMTLGVRAAVVLGMFDEAERLLRCAESELPPSPGIALARFELALARGRHDGALELVLDVLNAPPLSAAYEPERSDHLTEAVLLLIATLRDRGKLADAMQAAVLLRSLRPRSALAAQAAIELALSNGNASLALESGAAAVSADALNRAAALACVAAATRLGDRVAIEVWRARAARCA